MKRAGLSILVCLAVAAQPAAIAPGSGAALELIVEKTGLLSGKKHLLVWERFEGSFTPSPAAVRLAVDAASVKVNDDWLGDSKKADVRKETLGKDVLDAARFPKIEFAATGVSGDVNEAFRIEGLLTVRGIAKPVTLQVRKTARGYEGDASFPMSAFGIKPPKAALGAIGTKDLMTLKFFVPSR